MTFIKFITSNAFLKERKTFIQSYYIHNSYGMYKIYQYRFVPDIKTITFITTILVVHEEKTFIQSNIYL